jgi:hypothetical protein
MRGLDEQHLLENGQNVICDGCNMPSEIVAVAKTTVVRLRQA